MGSIFLEVQNESFTTTPLSGAESDLFNKQWEKIFLTGWDYERQLISSRMADIKAGVEAAKNALSDKTFGGFNCAAGELGISMIRPGHVGLAKSGSCTAAEADNTWVLENTLEAPTYANLFQGWIHSPNAGTTNFKVHEDAFIIPLYLVEYDASPKVQCVKMEIGRTDVLFYDVYAMQCRDNAHGMSIMPLPTTFWKPQIDVAMSIQGKGPGTCELRLGGFTIAEGTFLNGSSYVGQDTDTANPTDLGWD